MNNTNDSFLLYIIVFSTHTHTVCSASLYPLISDGVAITHTHTHTHTHTYIQIRIITTVWSSLYHHKRSHSFLICMRERERESSVLHLLPSHTGILILIFIFFSSLFSMVHPSLAPPPPAGSIVDVSPLLLSPVQYSSASSCAHVITAAIPLRSASVITLHTHTHTHIHRVTVIVR